MLITIAGVFMGEFKKVREEIYALYSAVDGSNSDQKIPDQASIREFIKSFPVNPSEPDFAAYQFLFNAIAIEHLSAHDDSNFILENIGDFHKLMSFYEEHKESLLTSAEQTSSKEFKFKPYLKLREKIGNLGLIFAEENFAQTLKECRPQILSLDETYLTRIAISFPNSPEIFDMFTSDKDLNQKLNWNKVYKAVQVKYENAELPANSLLKFVRNLQKNIKTTTDSFFGFFDYLRYRTFSKEKIYLQKLSKKFANNPDDTRIDFNELRAIKLNPELCRFFEAISHQKIDEILAKDPNKISKVIPTPDAKEAKVETDISKEENSRTFAPEPIVAKSLEPTLMQKSEPNSLEKETFSRTERIPKALSSLVWQRAFVQRILGRKPKSIATQSIKTVKPDLSRQEVSKSVTSPITSGLQAAAHKAETSLIPSPNSFRRSGALTFINSMFDPEKIHGLRGCATSFPIAYLNRDRRLVVFGEKSTKTGFGKVGEFFVSGIFFRTGENSCSTKLPEIDFSGKKDEIKLNIAQDTDRETEISHKSRLMLGMASDVGQVKVSSVRAIKKMVTEFNQHAVEIKFLDALDDNIKHFISNFIRSNPVFDLIGTFPLELPRLIDDRLTTETTSTASFTKKAEPIVQDDSHALVIGSKTIDLNFSEWIEDISALLRDSILDEAYRKFGTKIDEIEYLDPGKINLEKFRIKINDLISPENFPYSVISNLFKIRCGFDWLFCAQNQFVHLSANTSESVFAQINQSFLQLLELLGYSIDNDSENNNLIRLKVSGCGDILKGFTPDGLTDICNTLDVNIKNIFYEFSQASKTPGYGMPNGAEYLGEVFRLIIRFDWALRGQKALYIEHINALLDARNSNNENEVVNLSVDSGDEKVDLNSSSDESIEKVSLSDLPKTDKLSCQVQESRHTTAFSI